MPVLCAVDAKKNRFYVRSFFNDGIIIPDGDYEMNDISEKLKDLNAEKVFVCGSDAELFIERFKSNDECDKKISEKFISLKSKHDETENLFTIAEDMIANKKPALQDFEGPVYIRASEAETNLIS